MATALEISNLVDQVTARTGVAEPSPTSEARSFPDFLLRVILAGTTAVVSAMSTTAAGSANSATLQSEVNTFDTVVVREGEYELDGTVYIPSNTRIAGSGRVVLYNADDHNEALMATNAAWAGKRGQFGAELATNARVFNIAIENLIFDGADAQGGHHSLWVIKTDGFTMRGCSFYSGASSLVGSGTGVQKFSFAAIDSTDLTIENTVFDSISDGLHFWSGCRNIKVDGVRGKTGDNLLAFVIAAYAEYESMDANGDLIRDSIENVIVRNVYIEDGCFQPIRLIGQGDPSGEGGQPGSSTAGGWKFRNFLFDGVYGSGLIDTNDTGIMFTSSAVATADGGTLDGADFENILCRNVEMAFDGAGAGLFDIDSGAGTLRDLTVENCGIRNQAGSSAGSVIRVRGGTIGRLHARGCYWPDASGQFAYIAGATAGEIHLDNCEFNSDGTAECIQTDSTIAHLRLTGCRVPDSAANLFAFINTGGSIGRITATDCDVSFTSFSAFCFNIGLGVVDRIIVNGGRFYAVAAGNTTRFVRAHTQTVALVSINNAHLEGWDFVISESGTGGAVTRSQWIGGESTDNGTLGLDRVVAVDGETDA